MKVAIVISNRVKCTKSFQEIGSALPPCIMEDIAELAANNGVDLNSVERAGKHAFLVGEVRTKLTITATTTRAVMTAY